MIALTVTRCPASADGPAKKTGVLARLGVSKRGGITKRSPGQKPLKRIGGRRPVKGNIDDVWTHDKFGYEDEDTDENEEPMEEEYFDEEEQPQRRVSFSDASCDDYY